MAEEELVIRPAREDELDKVAEVCVEAYAEYAAHMSPDAWSAFAVDIGNVRGRRMADADILVAERDGVIVGTVSQYWQWRGAQEGTSSLRLLAVEPHERGGGVGRSLMEYAIARAREGGKQRVALTTVVEMEFVRDLAGKLGFERDARLDHEPAPGVRAQGWALDL